MKKVTIGMFLVALSILLTLFSYGNVYALQSDTEIVYPENIIDYTDLTNISSFDINNNYIVYTLDKQKVILFEKSTRKYTFFDNFSNISKIKLAGNNIIVVDDFVYGIKDFKNDNIYKFSDIDISDIKAIDIDITDNSILIGLVNSTSFKLYTYNFDFETIAPMQTITPSSFDFSNAFALSINKKSAYVVCYTSPTDETYTTSLYKISHSSSNSPINFFQNFQSNAKVIDSFFCKGKEYITTFTSEILFLLSSNNEKLAEINISTQGNLQENIFPIHKITDLQFFDNKIYMSDSKYKTIQSASINISTTDTSSECSIKCDEIILGSSGFDYGRFNYATDIYIQGNTYVVCDSSNNRIHILQNNISSFINLPSTATSPKCLTIDSKQNIYVSVVVDNKIQIWKYTFSNGNYSHSETFDTYNNTNISNVSDMCADSNDNIYIIADNQILYLSKDKLIAMNTSDISVNSTSQITYIPQAKLLAISTNNIIYFIKTDGTFYTQKEIPNLQEITSDIDKLYAITPDNIYTLDISNEDISSISKEISTSNYSHFTFDVIKQKFMAFDTNKSCLTYLTFENEDIPFKFEDITGQTSLKTSSTFIPLEINNTLIYEYPYELGNIYNIDSSIKYAIGIDTYDNYYRVLFAQDNQLQIGFVRISDVNQVEHKYSAISVITTNQTVPLYKYPTLLTYNDQRLITDVFDINKKITLIYKYPISIDGKTFYTYQNGENIGFIFEADVVLYSNKTITNLNTENASIHLIGKDSTILLKDDLTTRIKILRENDRIYVENYDKNKTYTKVILKDINLNTYEGYVLTSDIKMDKLDNSKVILIIIIIASLLLLAFIITLYIIIKKKNK